MLAGLLLPLASEKTDDLPLSENGLTDSTLDGIDSLGCKRISNTSVSDHKMVKMPFLVLELSISPDASDIISLGDF